MSNQDSFLDCMEAPDQPETMPILSVIVPVRNEQSHLASTLVQILEQRYPQDRFEVLVADGRSTDATREVVKKLQKKYSNLLLLDNPRQWSSSGRNEAIRNSQGEILLLIDGHCEIDNPEYFLEVAEAFQRSGADCLGRPQPLDIKDATSLQEAIASARASRLGHHPESFIFADTEGFVPPQSVAVAYRREVFGQVGLFDETFDACEDVEFNQRVAQAGMRCFFTSRAAVRYTPRDSLVGLWRQMLRYGRGRARLLKKHPETFSWTGFAPAFLLLGLIIGPLLGWLLPALFPVYLAAVITYTAIVVLFSLTLSARARRPSWLLQLPLIFCIVHLAAGMGICWELFLGPTPPPGRIDQGSLLIRELT